MMSVDFSQIMNIILAIFAFGTLITAILTFRQTKEFEKQRIRPMMQAHLRMAEDPFFCAELVISNPGQTIAHNVKFEFIPDLPKPPPEKTAASTKPQHGIKTHSTSSGNDSSASQSKPGFQATK